MEPFREFHQPPVNTRDTKMLKLCMLDEKPKIFFLLKDLNIFYNNFVWKLFKPSEGEIENFNDHPDWQNVENVC